MSDFGNYTTPVARKPHRCVACCATIPKNEKHYHFTGVYDEEWQNWRMHDECYSSFAADGYGDIFEGEYPVPERIRENQTNPTQS